MKKFKFKNLIRNSELKFHIGSTQLNSDFPVHIHDFNELVIITGGFKNKKGKTPSRYREKYV